MDNIEIQGECDRLADEAHAARQAATDILICLDTQEEEGENARRYNLIEQAEEALRQATDWLNAAAEESHSISKKLGEE